MRKVDPEHPFVLEVIARFGAVGSDGELSAVALGELDRLLAAYVRGPLADALWNALVFAQFFESTVGGGVGAQLLGLVETHAERLPLELTMHIGDASLAAKRLGGSVSLRPVGADAPPKGSFRGGLALRLVEGKQAPPRTRRSNVPRSPR